MFAMCFVSHVSYVPMDATSAAKVSRVLVLPLFLQDTVARSVFARSVLNCHIYCAHLNAQSPAKDRLNCGGIKKLGVCLI